MNHDHAGASVEGHAPQGCDLAISDAIHTAHFYAEPPVDPVTMANHGAQRASMVGGTLSVIHNATAVARGDKTAPGAVVDTVVDTASAAATGAAMGAVGTLARSAFHGIGLGPLARTAAPVAIGLTAAAVGHDAIALSRGRITDAQFKQRLVVNAFRGGTSWFGMEAGAFLGTLLLPAGGTVVGAILGGWIGHAIGSWLAEERPTARPPRDGR